MSAPTRFHRIAVRGGAAELEIASALAWEAGASGCEERRSRGEGGSGSELIVYAESRVAPQVESSLRDWSQRHAPALVVTVPEAVVDVDWTLRHRDHQPAVDISPRLRVRPPWLPGAESDVVLQARRAFGTGAHASTALALEALDRHLESAPVHRVLDVGCGSGVLAIAALRCGAREVLACDIDAVAARETAENARANRVDSRMLVWCGGLEALESAPVDLAVANMIRSEVLPLLPALSSRVRPGGWLWLSGLLKAERGALEAALRRAGFAIESELERIDTTDHWIALGASRSTDAIPQESTA